MDRRIPRRGGARRMHLGAVNMTSPRKLLEPQTGYWLIRVARGGPDTPACIQYEQTKFEPEQPGNTMDRSPILTARIQGQIVPVARVWHTRGTPIDKAEHNYRLALGAWAKEHAPLDPAADPYRQIDPLTSPIPTF